MSSRPRVYLAGPDVFLPDPLARGETLRAICARHGLAGVYPLDPLEAEPPEWARLAEWRRIALRNEAHIRSCHALVANLTPFRGPSADVGTVFELGFARALGLPVFGWSNVTVPFAERARAFVAAAADGMAVEAFGCVDNLMIDGAIGAQGGRVILANPPAAATWTALEAFEGCVAACGRVLA